MTKTKVIFYKEKGRKNSPVLEWLDTIPIESSSEMSNKD